MPNERIPCNDLILLDFKTLGLLCHAPFLPPFIQTLCSITCNVYAKLRPGGRLVLIQPNFRLTARRYFDDYTHRTIFTDVSLPDLVASRGFRRERVEARFLPFSMQSRLSFGYRLAPLYLRLPWRPLAGQMLVIASRPA